VAIARDQRAQLRDLVDHGAPARTFREHPSRALDDRAARGLRVIDERPPEPHLARDADQPELGDIADLDPVQRALLADMELATAEQIEQLDPTGRHRADLEQTAM